MPRSLGHHSSPTPRCAGGTACLQAHVLYIYTVLAAPAEAPVSQRAVHLPPAQS